MNIHDSIKTYFVITTLAATVACTITACSNEQVISPNVATASEASKASAATEAVPQPGAAVTQLTPDGPLFPNIPDIVVPDIEPAPDYLRIGLEHPIVAELQQQLMNLGFMDNDEPTQYYGEVTVTAVKSFQRQNGLAQDGIVGPESLISIMSPDAKYYAVEKGVAGADIQRIQGRLYELGYLATSDMVTGTFGDATEAAVIKLQTVNDLETDGKVGHQTINLLYSDSVKPNMLTYGEKSDVVMASQQRLKDLGYMISEPDGTYGSDTSIAIRQFQARNDLIVDGYLGPSTRITLNGAEAQPNGLTLGEQGETVQRVQQLLNKYGYLNSANVTGYYGEVTQNAVKSFQKTNSLSTDGSVGVLTMNKLTGSDVKKAPAERPNHNSSGSSSGKDTPPSGGNKPGASSSGNGGATIQNGSGVSSLISVAQSKIGCPYVYGSKGPNSFDCSGFVYWCLNQVGVKQSYLTSSGWRNVGRYTKISNFSDLQAGDIVVVNGHVGIAAGGGQVIDASSSHGRVVQRGLSSWWAGNFICGWRIFG